MLEVRWPAVLTHCIGRPIAGHNEEKWEGLAMGFRFRKSIKLFPGVTLNFSKSGISTSIGKPGATVNFSSRGTKTTVDIPGTGISYSESSSTHSSHSARPSQGLPFARPQPPSQTQFNGQPSKGMGFGALLGWGIVALIGFLMISGLFTK